MTRVRVPVADVRIAEAGEEPIVYQLEGELFAEVPDGELQRFLQLVPGAEVAEDAAKPAAEEK